MLYCTINEPDVFLILNIVAIKTVVLTTLSETFIHIYTLDLFWFIQ